MFHDVRDGLLQDPQHHRFGVWIQRARYAFGPKLELQRSASQPLFRDGAERRGEVPATKRRRPHIPHGATRVLERLLRQRDQVAQRGDDLRWAGHSTGGREQLKRDAGESLEQRIVDLSRESGPLVEHRREPRLHRPLPRPTQRPLCALAVGDVHDGAHKFDDLPALVEHRLAAGVHVADRAVRTHDADVHVVCLLVADRGLHRCLGPLPIVWVPHGG